MKESEKTIRIKGFLITVIREDGSFSSDFIDGDQEFVIDIYSHIRKYKSLDHVSNAITYLLNIGSKAIIGINPKNYENSTKTLFGDTRNIRNYSDTTALVRKIRERRDDYSYLKISLDDKELQKEYEMKIYVLDWVLGLFEKK